MAFLHSPIQWHIEGRHWRNSRVTSFLYFCKKRVCHRLAQHALWELPAVHCNLTQNSSLHLLTFTFNFLHCCYRITASTYDMLDPKFIAFKQREVPHQIPQVFLKPLIYSIYQVTRTFWVAAQQPSVISPYSWVQATWVEVLQLSSPNWFEHYRRQAQQFQCLNIFSHYNRWWR